MAVQELILTRKEYEELKNRQEFLVTKRREEVAENLRIARGFGDLSENAEYDDAKNEQAILEAEIAMNEAKLQNAKVIEEYEIDANKVHVGSCVKVYDEDLKEEEEFFIVGAASSDVASNKISRESPIGSALLGKEKGDRISIETPGGQVTMKILEISIAG